MPSVLVTGANGFVGARLCAALARDGVSVRAAVRSSAQLPALPCPAVAVGDIDAGTDWRDALRGVDTVAHLAARAHVMADSASDRLEAYRRVNVAGTVQLARAAVAAGVRRIVFVSSIKVNGESSGQPGFNESDVPQPEDEYGVSKLEAERLLADVCAGAATECSVLRPPLVYGPGVKGNLAALLRAIDRGVPLPLGCIDNARSLLGVDNLVAAIRLCLEHPDASGRTFVVSDDQPVSSKVLARTIAAALGRPARLLPIPVTVLRALGALTGHSAAVKRLTGSLVVDNRSIRDHLGWRQVSSFEHGIRAMADGYLHARV
jgi:nucleoside-diphosphate-sugar epimerase